MEEDTVVALPRPGAAVEADPLLAVLREGDRRLLMLAVETPWPRQRYSHSSRPPCSGSFFIQRYRFLTIAQFARAAGLSVPSGLAPPPLADEGRPSPLLGGRDAVRSVRVGGGDGAGRAHRPGLQALPLPRLRQAVQRAHGHGAEPDPVPLRRRRPRRALAPSLQAEPARPARDVRRPRHRVQP